ncbi:MAG: hypothetical protein B7Z55_18255 [Planctomycetales bacterium 12-60-4]|nr:MAG: hypothetical protein B7Z55_18255 [Planctomycetales bacterium 12-60-4]
MPPFEQFADTIVDYLKDHAVKIITGLALMALGWFFGRRRARRDWKEQKFLDRLNISLNILHEGSLQIRTLSEKRCEDVFLNSVAAARVTEAAAKTTATDPLLPFPKDDYWYYLNSVLNELSEQFAVGHLRRDLKCPVQTAKYLMCLTCECEGEIRTRKVRAMVIKHDILTTLPEDPPKFGASHHKTRWTTMLQMKAEYAKNPWRFIEVELSA